MNPSVKQLLNQSGPLAENEVKDLLRAYGIPTTKYQLVQNEKDLDRLSVKFPVALKVCSAKDST